MNERIKELAEQARINVSQKNYGYYWIESADGIEKFAELIIKECMQACINEGKTFEVESAGEYSSNLYATAIKKHFGVEE